MKKENLVTIVLAFFLGLMVAILFSQNLVPDVRAGTKAAKIAKWEYNCHTMPGPGVIEKMTPRANELGKDGWEMVGWTYTNHYSFWCFKRPK